MTRIITSLLVFAALLLSQVLFAQSVFDKFDGPEDVKTIIVNKKMFEMMSKVKANDKETQQYVNLLKKLDNLKVFITSSNKQTAEMRATADKYLKTSGMDELMRISDGGKNVKIYMRSGANDTIVKELFMFIEGNAKDNETVLFSLTGNFNLDEISALTDQMNLPGGDNLKKASKKNK
ncbi:DUF4252 domain-containing protein [Flavobacterium lacus]|jgi:hypothetical protein|uniref:Uncharacterized protein DUF4252 n=1 Tax=Flavobacterium lacus TaxID=1353778 RepID=A0A328WRT6_9FLAO|nr:DUF4252 domain-containing protein [Flavobacterium lacus]RAR47147.1 uncharacterized protein DUF4252 [Flavobacterium lacus]